METFTLVIYLSVLVYINYNLVPCGKLSFRQHVKIYTISQRINLHHKLYDYTEANRNH